jgi:hypothetical protein
MYSEAAEEEGERSWGPTGDSQGEGRERGEMRAAKKMWKKVGTCFIHFFYLTSVSQREQLG